MSKSVSVVGVLARSLDSYELRSCIGIDAGPACATPCEELSGEDGYLVDAVAQCLELLEPGFRLRKPGSVLRVEIAVD